MLLKDKTALVTGAARGIGLGIARALAAQGARVAIVDLRLAEATQAAQELGAGAIALGADVARETEIAAAAQQAAERLGGLDFFVNNAGGVRTDRPESFAGMGNPFTRVTEAGWDEQLQTHLRTVFAGCKAAIPWLTARGGGALINIASIAGLLPVINMPAYGAAKAGVISLTRTLALELAPQRIRVNAICPGMLWTRAWEMAAGAMKQGNPALQALEPRQIFLEVVRRSVPLGEEQTPEEIGELTAYLCSRHARNLTGQALVLDGGQMLKSGG